MVRHISIATLARHLGASHSKDRFGDPIVEELLMALGAGPAAAARERARVLAVDSWFPGTSRGMASCGYDPKWFTGTGPYYTRLLGGRST